MHHYEGFSSSPFTQEGVPWRLGDLPKVTQLAGDSIRCEVISFRAGACAFSFPWIVSILPVFFSLKTCLCLCVDQVVTINKPKKHNPEWPKLLDCNPQILISQAENPKFGNVESKVLKITIPKEEGS